MAPLERLARAIVGGDIADVFSSGPGTVTLVVLFVATVLAVLWRGWSSASARGGVGAPMPTAPVGAPTGDRRGQWEEMWRAEEEGLWRWMEERAGVEALRAGAPAARREAAPGAERVAGGLDWGALDGMAEREVMEAIRVTKERLERLEGVVQQKRGGADEAVEMPA